MLKLTLAVLVIATLAGVFHRVHYGDAVWRLEVNDLQLGRVSLEATDVVIEVNPRHVRYYQRAFGFRAFGAERRCERVGAPARLLHLNLVAADSASRPGLALH